MKLNELLSGIEVVSIIGGNMERNIGSVCTDSRRCSDGALFVAIKGVDTD